MRMDGEMEGERDSVERERERYLTPAETGLWAYGGWCCRSPAGRSIYEGCL